MVSRNLEIWGHHTGFFCLLDRENKNCFFICHLIFHSNLLTQPLSLHAITLSLFVLSSPFLHSSALRLFQSEIEPEAIVRLQSSRPHHASPRSIRESIYLSSLPSLSRGCRDISFLGKREKKGKRDRFIFCPGDSV